MVEVDLGSFLSLAALAVRERSTRRLVKKYAKKHGSVASVT